MKSGSLVMAVLGLSVLLTTPVASDMFQPRSSCHKPSKPWQFNSQWELDRFSDDVDQYKRCIENFVSKQQNEANAHLEAASDAIEEWNRFVRYELN